MHFLYMVMSVDSSQEVYVCIRLESDDSEKGVGSSKFNDGGTEMGKLVMRKQTMQSKGHQKKQKMKKKKKVIWKIY